MHVNFVLAAVFVIIPKIQAFPADLDEGMFWPIPQEDANIPWIIGEEISTITELPEYSSSDIPDKIYFHLYTEENVMEPVDIDMNDIETLVRSSYDFRNPTYFLIPGWKDEFSYNPNSIIKKAIFQTNANRKLNYITVDWRVYSLFNNYTISQGLCSRTGKVVAHFIDWMHVNAKLSFETLNVYGISLGAQVAGFAGKNVQRGKIHSIVGMDPALPRFQFSNPKDRLADTDAEYVETIHTNGGHWGFYEPIGQTAFYPNGGKYQPGCGSDEDGLCSHQRAVNFMAEALSSPEENEFYAVRCEKLEHVKERKCEQYTTIIRLGDPKNAQKPRGIYYLETNSESPYARGVNDIFKKRKK